MYLEVIHLILGNDNRSMCGYICIQSEWTMRVLMSRTKDTASHIRRVATNILNKQSRIANKGWFSRLRAWRVGRGTKISSP